MKTKHGLLTAALVMGFATACFAQMQFGAAASYLKGTGNNDAGLWGGGIGAKFFLGDNVLAGGALHAYPKRSFSVESHNSTYTSTDWVTNTGVSLEYLMHKKESQIRPYIGGDAGLSFNNQTVTYINETSQLVENKNNKVFFIVSPKAGINLGLGQAFGIFGEVRYNFTFGKGNPNIISIEGANDLVVTEQVTKYFTFDAGIYIKLERAKKEAK